MPVPTPEVLTPLVPVAVLIWPEIVPRSVLVWFTPAKVENCASWASIWVLSTGAVGSWFASCVVSIFMKSVSVNLL